MNKEFEKLTEDEITELMNLYNLKRNNVKSNESGISFQVIRSRAIRKGMKVISIKHNVVQKNVHLYDTHKNGTIYEIILGCQKGLYLIKVDITDYNNMKVKSVEETNKKSF